MARNILIHVPDGWLRRSFQYLFGGALLAGALYGYLYYALPFMYRYQAQAIAEELTSMMGSNNTLMVCFKHP